MRTFFSLPRAYIFNPTGSGFRRLGNRVATTDHPVVG
jgi:hypothetical protein